MRNDLSETGDLTMGVVRASDILPERLIRGSGYVVKQRVEIHGHRYLVRVSTDYGVISALGLPMLELRFHEHFAIQSLRETSESSLVLHGVVEAMKEAPVGALTLLSDPIGSVIRYPQGMRRGAGEFFDRLEKRGGGMVRRRIAHAVGADPESRNPVLSKLLDQIARRKSFGRFGAKMGLGNAIPILGMLASNEENRLIVREESPRAIAGQVTARLVELGVKARISKSFATSMLMTSTEKLLVTSQLETLHGVRGLGRLVALSRAIDTESDLLAYMQQLRVLAGLHQQDPIQKIEVLFIPVAHVHSGGIVAFAAVDHLRDSPVLCKAIDAYRKRMSTQDATLLIGGTATHAARHRLQAAGIDVIDLTRSNRLQLAS